MAKKKTEMLAEKLMELKEALKAAEVAEREAAERELIRLARAGACVDELTRMARSRADKRKRERQSAAQEPAA